MGLLVSTNGSWPNDIQALAYPGEISLTLPCDQPLDFIYYAIAREHLGETEIFYEYTIEEGAQGPFQVTLPALFIL